MTDIGTESRFEIKVIPAQVTAIEHRQHKYACRPCDKKEINTPVKKAKAVPGLIAKSLASPSAIAYMMHQKYVNYMPLYRQESDFKRMGIALTRQVMANWVIKGAEKLKPLYYTMKDELLSKSHLHTDDTKVQVLSEPGREPQTKSFMWLYSTCKHDVPIYIYEYTQGRGAVFPQKFFGDYEGVCHADCYIGYDKLAPKILVSACWSHARRKYTDAIEAMKEKDPNCVAAIGVKYCDALFNIEREIENKTPEIIYETRQERSIPIVKEYFAWVAKEHPHILSGTLTGKALQYSINQKEKLMRFLEYGRLEISNNRAERAIKPFVQARKNFLFCETPAGAHSSAIIFSLIETAKANSLRPFHYLTFIFEKIQYGELTEETASRFLP